MSYKILVPMKNPKALHVHAWLADWRGVATVLFLYSDTYIDRWRSTINNHWENKFAAPMQPFTRWERWSVANSALVTSWRSPIIKFFFVYFLQKLLGFCDISRFVLACAVKSYLHGKLSFPLQLKENN